MNLPLDDPYLYRKYNPGNAALFTEYVFKNGGGHWLLASVLEN